MSPLGGQLGLSPPGAIDRGCVWLGFVLFPARIPQVPGLLHNRFFVLGDGYGSSESRIVCKFR